MKKLSIATSLLLGLALSVSACGKDKKAPAATPTTEPAPVATPAAPATPPAAAPPAAPAPATADKPKADDAKAGGW